LSSINTIGITPLDINNSLKNIHNVDNTKNYDNNMNVDDTNNFDNPKPSLRLDDHDARSLDDSSMAKCACVIL